MNKISAYILMRCHLQNNFFKSPSNFEIPIDHVKYAKIVAGVTTLNKKAKNLTKLADKPVEC